MPVQSFEQAFFIYDQYCTVKILFDSTYYLPEEIVSSTEFSNASFLFFNGFA